MPSEKMAEGAGAPLSDSAVQGKETQAPDGLPSSRELWKDHLWMDPQKRPGELIQELVGKIKKEDFSKRSQALTLEHRIQRTMKKIGVWDDFFIAEDLLTQVLSELERLIALGKKGSLVSTPLCRRLEQARDDLQRQLGSIRESRSQCIQEIEHFHQAYNKHFWAAWHASNFRWAEWLSGWSNIQRVYQAAISVVQRVPSSPHLATAVQLIQVVQTDSAFLKLMAPQDPCEKILRSGFGS
ncbi:MAG: hypothetical protein HYY62_08320 [Deltaproteobacteria bacterium]|nr:hypothetical protein [Deltaproteobacteria bacterium]